MKKLFALLLCLLMAMTSVTALAAPYEQRLANEATFETLEEARLNGPAAGLFCVPAAKSAAAH